MDDADDDEAAAVMIVDNDVNIHIKNSISLIMVLVCMENKMGMILWWLKNKFQSNINSISIYQAIVVLRIIFNILFLLSSLCLSMAPKPKTDTFPY